MGKNEMGQITSVYSSRPNLLRAPARFSPHLLIFVGTLLYRPCLASDETTRERETIIELIEDDLAAAYTYTKSSRHRVPHFEVLDRIFPGWHHGNPAVGRQFWVEARYRAFIVHYRVDSVFMTNAVTAIVRGKKLAAWSERKTDSGLQKLWPVQLWTHLTTRRYQDNNYLSSIYAMRFEMKLTRAENGGWIIATEKLYDNPQMENSLSHRCDYQKQFADWGLKSDCE